MGTLRHFVESLDRSRARMQAFSAMPKLLDFWETELPAQEKEALEKLAIRGWFFGPNMPVNVIRPLGFIVESEGEAVDTAFGRLVCGQLDEIEREVTEYYPHRSDLLREAFCAHRQGLYSLSVQSFLIQSDGIFFEKHKVTLFTKKGNTRAKTLADKEEISPFRQTIRHPLGVNLTLWQGTGALEHSFAGLNRHKVLHGNQLNYNSEVHSLQALSFLHYLCWVLNMPD